MLQRLGFSFVVALLVMHFAHGQERTYRIVFSSREYKAVGLSYPQRWMMTLPEKQKTKYSEGACTAQPIASRTLPSDIRLPERSEHWNYLTSVSGSPDGKLLLVGSEAGSSDSHFEDYWLVDQSSRTWKYAGGGNTAKWSPDGSKILWSTPRELAPIGTIHVWVSHLVVVDIRTLQQRSVTAGVVYEDDFFWCSGS
jgi:dipeptidyl aminopeptidase/acylaminoacyl peptidase